MKENVENKEVRCFGSTHVDWSPKKILNKYHIRWPVETGIKDLIENYFLNRPTGSTPEKVETHYYCVMIARILVDYFRNVFCEPQWRIGIKSNLKKMLERRKECGLNKVAWWGGRGGLINIEDRFRLQNGPQI